MRHGYGVGGAKSVGIAVFRLPYRKGDVIQREAGRRVRELPRAQRLHLRALAPDTLGGGCPVGLAVRAADPHHADLGHEGAFARDLRKRNENLPASYCKLRQFRHQIEGVQQCGRLAGRSARRMGLLYQCRLRTRLRQMVGDARPDDPGSNDDNVVPIPHCRSPQRSGALGQAKTSGRQVSISLHKLRDSKPLK